MNRTVVLIDALNLVFRLHHTNSMLTTKDGQPSGAIFGTLRALASIHKALGPVDVLWCWEGNYGTERHVPNWRKQLTEPFEQKYKGNRKRTTDTKNVLNQVPQIMYALRILHYGQFYVPGLEADDLMGVISACLVKDSMVQKVLLLTTDQDMYQCIDDDTVYCAKIERSRVIIIRSKDVLKKYGVTPQDWSKWRALCGDTSDNYSGLYRVGPKKALEYLQRGLNPALQEFNQHSRHVQREFADVRDSWPWVHTCYLLSYIPRVAGYSLFPSACRKELRSQLGSLQHKRRRSVPKKSYESVLREWTSFCSTWELSTILAQRRAFLQAVEWT